jgi:hypothetical protein
MFERFTEKAIQLVVPIAKAKSFRHCSTINFIKDYFRQQSLQHFYLNPMDSFFLLSLQNVRTIALTITRYILFNQELLC